MNNLYKVFHQYFEIVIADTPELLEKVFCIRYQLICVDMGVPGYEPSLYPDGLERDDYDRHSAHILIRYRPSGQFIGTARLILFDQERPEKPFPVELHTNIDPNLFDISQFSRRHTGEISRFIIVKDFERRKAERRNYDTRQTNKNIVEIDRRSNDKTDRRCIKNLTLVLGAGIMRVSEKFNVHNWFSIMDPVMNRLLGYYGMDLRPIGPITEHHGLRRPYFVEVASMSAKVKKKHIDAWEAITEYGKYSRFLQNKYSQDT